MSNKILFLGDVYLDDRYEINFTFDVPFILNLEAPLIENGVPIEGKINLKSPPILLQSVFRTLPLSVSLANNHIVDYGNEGFENTISFLKTKGIKYFGAGKPEDNYNNPLIIQLNGIKIGLLGYCYQHFYDQIKQVKGLKYGPAPLNYDLIRKDINKLREQADRVVIQLHWGTLFSNYPEKEDVILARKLVELGVDIIIGHHTHTIQPIENYRNSVIAYGLGNFIFPDLKLSTHYNALGIPTKSRNLKQRIWNNSSGGLIVDLETLEYTTEYYYFNGDFVKKKNTIFHRHLSFKLPQDLDKLDQLRRQNLRIKKIINWSLKFVDGPKTPSK